MYRAELLSESLRMYKCAEYMYTDRELDNCFLCTAICLDNG